MEGVPQSGKLRKTCPWKLCERGKAQLELTSPNITPLGVGSGQTFGATDGTQASPHAVGG